MDQFQVRRAYSLSMTLTCHNANRTVRNLPLKSFDNFMIMEGGTVETTRLELFKTFSSSQRWVQPVAVEIQWRSDTYATFRSFQFRKSTIRLWKEFTMRYCRNTFRTLGLIILSSTWLQTPSVLRWSYTKHALKSYFLHRRNRTIRSTCEMFHESRKGWPCYHSHKWRMRAILAVFESQDCRHMKY